MSLLFLRAECSPKSAHQFVGSCTIERTISTICTQTKQKRNANLVGCTSGQVRRLGRPPCVCMSNFFIVSIAEICESLSIVVQFLYFYKHSSNYLFIFLDGALVTT